MSKWVSVLPNISMCNNTAVELAVELVIWREGVRRSELFHTVTSAGRPRHPPVNSSAVM